MTAQVAVLTTRGVAIASDSAVTIGDGRQSRSYQSAEKIFPIHGVPLAVLHSGNAAIWGVPWQLLVEMWAQTRDQGQLASMIEYAAEFRHWLEGQSNLATTDAQDEFIRACFREYMLSIRGDIRQALDLDDDQLTPGVLTGKDAEPVDALVADYVAALTSRPDFANVAALDSDAVSERLAEKFMEDLAWIFDDTPGTETLAGQALVIARLLLTKAEPFRTDAVLAFVGYGKDDYFPSIAQMTVAGMVDGVVRVYDESDSAVTSDDQVTIIPLGLTEAIHAFLRGVSPQYRDTAHRVLAECLPADEEEATGALEDGPHQRLDAEFDELEWTEFLAPMLAIVRTLPLVETDPPGRLAGGACLTATTNSGQVERRRAGGRRARDQERRVRVGAQQADRQLGSAAALIDSSGRTYGSRVALRLS